MPDSTPATQPCARCGHALPQGFLGNTCPACLLLAEPSDSISATGETHTIRIDSDVFIPPVRAGGNAPPQHDLEVIGPYRLLEPLGEGGFGVVYRALQQEPIRREVALKLIKPGMTSAEIIARFETERQALALMEHPNIARVYDAGTTPEGLPYFVMEYVDGVPLTTYCDSHRLTVRERLVLFGEVCDAVQHAHQKAILHRDLKPSNVLVTEMDGRPEPKVIDFGIAKALEISQEKVLQASLARTQAGMVVGTPQYMSPEQAGSVPDVDTRSDVYTLGIILHELLTGETPLSRENLKKVALDEVLRMIREVETRRPSSRLAPATDAVRETATRRQTEPSRLCHSLRGELDWIMLKALEKERERRYQSASLLAEDVRRYLRHEPVSAGPPQFRYRAIKFLRRNRGPVAAALLVLLTILGGLATTLWQWNVALQEATRANSSDRRRLDLLQMASAADHEAAWRAYDSQKHAEALAHIVRALELRGDNTAALVTSASMSFGFNSQLCRTARAIVFDGPVTCSAVRCDSKVAAVGSDDHTLRIVELDTGAELFRQKFDERIHRVAFSSDGQLLAVGAWNRTAYVLDATSGKRLSETRLPDWVQHLEFHPDSRRLVLVSGYGLRGRVVVVEATTGRELMKKDFANPLMTARFSSDGKNLAVGAADSVAGQRNGVSLFDTTTWTIKSVFGLGGAVSALDFSPEGNQFIVTATRDSSNVEALLVETDGLGTVRSDKLESLNSTPVDGRVVYSPDANMMIAMGRDIAHKLLRVADGAEIAILQTGGFLRDAAFSPDARWLAAGCEDKALRMFETSSGKVVGETFFESDINTVSFSPDGLWLIAGSSDGTLRVLETGCCPMSEHLQLLPDATGVVEFSPDSNWLAVLGGPSTLQRLHVSTGKRVEDLQILAKATQLAISPDGTKIALGGGDDRVGEVMLVDHPEGRMLGAWKLPGRVRALCFSPDGRRLGVSAGDYSKPGEAQVVEIRSGRVLVRLESPRGFSSFEFSPDGQWCAAGSEEGTVEVANVDTGEIRMRKRLDGRVYALASSNDGERLCVGSSDSMARVFDIRTGAEEFRLPAGDRVDVVRYAPLGKWLSTGSADNKLRLFDAVSGAQYAEIEFRDWIKDISFSKSGTWLAATSMDHSARIIEAASGKIACRVQFDDWVWSAKFSADEQWLALGSWDNTARLLDARWLHPGNEKVSDAFLDAVRNIAGGRFNTSGKFVPLTNASSREEDSDRPDIDYTPWQKAVLNWAQTPASIRTTSPWANEPIHVAVGRWLMAARNDSRIILRCADNAPWHPLIPVSLARLVSRPTEEMDSITRNTLMNRKMFLARLTQKRLREARVNIYGSEALTRYAAIASKWMEEMKIPKEVSEIKAGPAVVSPTINSGSETTRVTPQTSPSPLTPTEASMKADKKVEEKTVGAQWHALFFPWSAESDPVKNLEAWRKIASAPNLKSLDLNALEMDFLNKSPEDILPKLKKGGLPGHDYFGMIATAKIPMTKGRWKFVVDADDGVRVTVNGQPLIEEWSYPRRAKCNAVWDQPAKADVDVRVEYFENDGWAMMKLRIHPEP